MRLLCGFCGSISIACAKHFVASALFSICSYHEPSWKHCVIVHVVLLNAHFSQFICFCELVEQCHIVQKFHGLFRISHVRTKVGEALIKRFLFEGLPLLKWHNTVVFARHAFAHNLFLAQGDYGNKKDRKEMSGFIVH